MATPKFLLCHDPTPGSEAVWGVLHTQLPRFLATVTRQQGNDMSLIVMVEAYDVITSPDPILMNELSTFIDRYVPL